MSRRDDRKTRFVAALYDIGAIQFGAFRLKLHETQPDAPLSPIYVDLRMIRSHPDVRDGAIHMLAHLAGDRTFDILADVPTAATPLVAILAHELRKPMITPREAKTHGSGARIDGTYRSGQRVLLVDDLITRADSKLEAIRTLEAAGLIVRDVAVLVDREQGGAAQLHARGYALHAACTLHELLDEYLATDKIDRAKYDEVLTYLATNR